MQTRMRTIDLPLLCTDQRYSSRFQTSYQDRVCHGRKRQGRATDLLDVDGTLQLFARAFWGLAWDRSLLCLQGGGSQYTVRSSGRISSTMYAESASSRIWSQAPKGLTRLYSVQTWSGLVCRSCTRKSSQGTPSRLDRVWAKLNSRGT